MALLCLHYTSDTTTTWRDVPQVVGLGELIPATNKASGTAFPGSEPTGSRKLGGWDPKASFIPGTTKTLGSDYTRTLVMSTMAEDDVGWVHDGLPDIVKAIYVADNSTAPLHPVKNKGHEVMVYLTHIVNNYDNLPDVSIFMHAHRWTWHNNDLQHHDALEMITMLSSERVQRVGYMNLRCHWNPGCPDWMHPGTMEGDINKQEETLIANAWSELFPHDPIPQVLASACCAQFAISRDRIRSIPLATYKFYQKWVLTSQLPDYLSGRIWEYLWAFVFTGESSTCPSQHGCYCDGYGICFEGEAGFDGWLGVRYKMEKAQLELVEWHRRGQAIKDAMFLGMIDEAAQLQVPEMGRDAELEVEVEHWGRELTLQRDIAIERGRDPRVRALESGRDWKEGDGY